MALQEGARSAYSSRLLKRLLACVYCNTYESARELLAVR